MHLEAQVLVEYECLIATYLKENIIEIKVVDLERSKRRRVTKIVLKSVWLCTLKALQKTINVGRNV